MIKTDKAFDVILVTGDIHIDHPLCSTGIISRVLEKNGFSVGIIEQPDWKSNEDFIKLGKPNLFFGVTSGAMDSMIDNYTPLKKERKYDKYSKYISKRLKKNIELDGIEGTCVYSKEIPKGFEELPDFESILKNDEQSKKNFCRMQLMFSSSKNLAQKYGN